MNTQSAADYLQQAGIRYTYSDRDKREARFPCPMCNEDEGFNLNLASGLWKCKRAKCGAVGNLYRLKVLRGDALEVSSPAPRQPATRATPKKPTKTFNATAWTKALWAEPAAAAARDYLEARGISETVAKQAELGFYVSRKHSGQAWITIPYHENGRCSLVKTRAVPPEPRDEKGRPIRYERMPGGDSPLYAPCGLSFSEPVVIVAGEIDALSILQIALDAGYERMNVCAPSAGEDAWQAAWTRQLEPATDIIVLYDNDSAGELGAAEAANHLGRHRCRIGRWPDGVKDGNEALLGGVEWFGLQRIMGEARAPIADAVIDLADMAAELMLERDRGPLVLRGSSTGWRRVDELIGGWRPGEVTLLSGETGTGKTCFATNAAVNQIRTGRRVLLWPAEIGHKRQARKVITQLASKRFIDLSQPEMTEMLTGLAGFCWLVRSSGRVSPTAFKETLLYAVHWLGVEFVVLDHLDHLAGLGEDQWEKRSELLEALLYVKTVCAVHFLIVAHPEKSKHGNRVIMNTDIKGRSDLIQAVDNGLSTYRERTAKKLEAGTPSFLADAKIICWKCRENVARGEGVATLHFDTRTELFVE